ANAMMRQLGFAAVDLSLHTGYVPSDGAALLAYSQKVMSDYTPVAQFDGYAFITGFGHLFSSAVGYAAGYYSYKWAEVLDADAFTRFKAEGVFSAEVGRAFRTAILERGDGADPMDLYQKFMGREPDPEALFERAGLGQAA
ncbi:MAG: M3 family metallopeptidase, partial [Myxococcota bacterium]